MAAGGSQPKRPAGTWSAVDRNAPGLAQKVGDAHGACALSRQLQPQRLTRAPARASPPGRAVRKRQRARTNGGHGQPAGTCRHGRG
eukprot:328062-Chlamydomonas_euryale.AAC.1